MFIKQNIKLWFKHSFYLVFNNLVSDFTESVIKKFVYNFRQTTVYGTPGLVYFKNFFYS